VNRARVLSDTSRERTSADTEITEGEPVGTVGETRVRLETMAAANTTESRRFRPAAGAFKTIA
jgi:hypothetical protein